MIGDWKLLSIYACKPERKKCCSEANIGYALQSSSLFHLMDFFFWKKMPNDDNGPDVHTAINNEVR